ncbi:MAG TPA: hypothetical protein VGI10_04665, partial [Polyangiaceae bacterium]
PIGQAGTIGASPNDMLNLQPVNLGTGRTAKFIAAGSDKTCAILDTNQLKCWGSNQYGALGLAVGNNPANGGVTSVGTTPGDIAALTPINLGTGRTAKAVTIGSWHVCALLDNNAVKCWGDNEDGSLGLGINGGGNIHGTDVGDGQNELGDALLAVNLGTGRTAKAIDAGVSHTCALLDNNQIKCWGSNSEGALGANLTSGLNVGRLSTDMGDNLRQVVLPSGRSAQAITAGGFSACALLDNEQIECWGANNFGELGVGDTATRGSSDNPMTGALVGIGTNLSAFSISMGSNHSACASVGVGWVKCWGNNGSGQLGDGDTTNRGAAPTDLGDQLPAVNLGSRAALQVAVGFNGACVALFDNSSASSLPQSNLKCWGDNTLGNLGQGDTLPRGKAGGQMGPALAQVDLGSDQNDLPYALNAVYSGGFHSCAVVSSFPFVLAQAKCWGYNVFGQLGLGDTNARGDSPGEMGDNLPFVNVGTNRTVGTIVEGLYSTCALLDTNQVKCWGFNNSGQLGLGDTNSRGDNPNEMGDSLPTVSLGTGRSVKVSTGPRTIASGWSHVCVILDNNTVKCWGANGSGQLGLGNTSARGDNANEMGNSLPTVNLGTGRTAKAITTGALHSCAILDTNQVKCWGQNNSGQLGLGDINNRGDNANEMGDSLPVVNLGTGRTAKSIAAAGNHTCALLDNNLVKCWGQNNFGQLGLGDTNNRGDNAGEMSALPTLNLGLGRTAIALVGGQSEFTCALLDDQQVKCWGQNNLGQLGQGDTNNRGDNAGELGDALHFVNLGPDRPRAYAAIAGGSDHACAVMTDGTASCWGDDGPGDLGSGINPPPQKSAPVQVVDSNFFPLQGVKAIAAGQTLSCAVLTDGTVDCWGSFANAGANSNVAVPVAGVSGAVAISIGGGQVCALLASGGASCWTVSFQAPTPATVNGLSGAIGITVGGTWACALISNGHVQCWGNDDSGQFGEAPQSSLSQPTPTNVPGITDAVALSGSNTGHHVCAVRATGNVVCWGQNRAGDIGDGSNPTNQIEPVTTVIDAPGHALTGAVGIVAGMIQHTCAVLSNGTVECWGDGGLGQLGAGAATTQLLNPSASAAAFGITNAVSVSAGDNFSCALLADGRAMCWGFDSSGELGDGSEGSIMNVTTPVPVRF